MGRWVVACPRDGWLLQLLRSQLLWRSSLAGVSLEDLIRSLVVDALVVEDLMQHPLDLRVVSDDDLERCVNILQLDLERGCRLNRRQLAPKLEEKGELLRVA